MLMKNLKAIRYNGGDVTKISSNGKIIDVNRTRNILASTGAEVTTLTDKVNLDVDNVFKFSFITTEESKMVLMSLTNDNVTDYINVSLNYVGSERFIRIVANGYVSGIGTISVTTGEQIDVEISISGASIIVNVNGAVDSSLTHANPSVLTGSFTVNLLAGLLSTNDEPFDHFKGIFTDYVHLEGTVVKCKMYIDNKSTIHQHNRLNVLDNLLEDLDIDLFEYTDIANGVVDIDQGVIVENVTGDVIVSIPVLMDANQHYLLSCFVDKLNDGVLPSITISDTVGGTPLANTEVMTNKYDELVYLNVDAGIKYINLSVGSVVGSVKFKDILISEWSGGILNIPGSNWIKAQKQPDWPLWLEEDTSVIEGGDVDVYNPSGTKIHRPVLNNTGVQHGILDTPLTLDTNFGVAVTFIKDNNTSSATLFGGEQDNINTVVLDFNSYRIRAFAYDGNGDLSPIIQASDADSNMAADGHVHVLELSYINGHAKIKLDGVLIGEDDWDLTTSVMITQVMSRTLAGFRRFSGAILDFKVWTNGDRETGDLILNIPFDEYGTDYQRNRAVPLGIELSDIYEGLSISNSGEYQTPYTNTSLDASKYYIAEMRIEEVISGSIKINTDSNDSAFITSSGVYRVGFTSSSYGSIQTGVDGFIGTVSLSIREWSGVIMQNVLPEHWGEVVYRDDWRTPLVPDISLYKELIKFNGENSGTTTFTVPTDEGFTLEWIGKTTPITTGQTFSILWSLVSDDGLEYFQLGYYNSSGILKVLTNVHTPPAFTLAIADGEIHNVTLKYDINTAEISLNVDGIDDTVKIIHNRPDRVASSYKIAIGDQKELYTDPAQYRLNADVYSLNYWSGDSKVDENLLCTLDLDIKDEEYQPNKVKELGIELAGENEPSNIGSTWTILDGNRYHAVSDGSYFTIKWAGAIVGQAYLIKYKIEYFGAGGILISSGSDLTPWDFSSADKSVTKLVIADGDKLGFKHDNSCDFIISELSIREWNGCIVEGTTFPTWEKILKEDYTLPENLPIPSLNRYNPLDAIESTDCITLDGTQWGLFSKELIIPVGTNFEVEFDVLIDNNSDFHQLLSGYGNFTFNIRADDGLIVYNNGSVIKSTTELVVPREGIVKCRLKVTDTKTYIGYNDTLEYSNTIPDADISIVKVGGQTTFGTPSNLEGIPFGLKIWTNGDRETGELKVNIPFNNNGLHYQPNLVKADNIKTFNWYYKGELISANDILNINLPYDDSGPAATASGDVFDPLKSYKVKYEIIRISAGGAVRVNHSSNGKQDESYQSSVGIHDMYVISNGTGNGLMQFYAIPGTKAEIRMLSVEVWTGTELVVDGTFEGDGSAWSLTNVNGIGSGSISNGIMTLEGSSFDNRTEYKQELTNFKVNDKILVEIDVVSEGNAFFFISDSQSGGINTDILTGTEARLHLGMNYYFLTLTNPEHWIVLREQDGIAEISNISIRKWNDGELVTDGGFDNGLTYWAPSDVTDSAVVTDGKLELTYDTVQQIVNQDIDTVENETYILKLNISNLSSTWGLQVGDLSLGNMTLTGDLEYMFTANHNNYIKLKKGGTAVSSVSFDNISIRKWDGKFTPNQIVGDWVVNPNGSFTYTGENNEQVLDSTFVAGNYYEIDFTISDRTTGRLEWKPGGEATTSEFRENGRFKTYVLASSTGIRFSAGFADGGRFDGTVSDIKISNFNGVVLQNALPEHWMQLEKKPWWDYWLDSHVIDLSDYEGWSLVEASNLASLTPIENGIRLTVLAIGEDNSLTAVSKSLVGLISQGHQYKFNGYIRNYLTNVSQISYSFRYENEFFSVDYGTEVYVDHDIVKVGPYNYNSTFNQRYVGDVGSYMELVNPTIRRKIGVVK